MVGLDRLQMSNQFQLRFRAGALTLVLWSLAIAPAWTDDLPSETRRPDAAASPAQLAPFHQPDKPGLHPAWILETLPDRSVAATQFNWMLVDQTSALRVKTDRSYGLLRHAWSGPHGPVLAWRWRLDEALKTPDLQTKQGDDAAIKVCVLFDQPLSQIGFLERAALALAREISQKPLPSATLCYVWDTRYGRGHKGHNPYTGRVRYIVVDDAQSPRQQWVKQARNLGSDFDLMFGSESKVLPPVAAVVVGADSDNTGQSSLAFVQNLRWLNR